MNVRPSLEALARLAITAGAEIMAVRAAGFEAMTKGDGSIVTIADQRAEAIIEQGLAALAPSIPMLGEEAAAAGRIPDTSDRYFCVDPLDGTRGFAKGGDEFTVNIGLIEHGAASMGVVLSPTDGALYAGEPGRALRARVSLDADAPIAFEPIAASGKQGDGWRIVASRTFGRTHEAKAFAAALGACSQDDASSSIKFCRVAEGAADLYPRFGDMNEWDSAAGHAILNAAGGGVMRLSGAPLIYGERTDGFLIRGLVAYANEAAASAAREALRKM
ncbi:MAG TPA: 3'(2'),5'-bisphosphate nucleotidase CysQ [Terricaulis sp.]|nr:3'(2'),5'-bisphosphate nucleotidase CysQ [Terricaulis sp.]